MTEITLEDGAFMGHTLRRTQLILPDRSFIPLSVVYDEAQAEPDHQADAMAYAVGAARNMQQQGLAGQLGPHQIHQAQFPTAAQVTHQQQQMMAQQQALHEATREANSQLLTHASPGMVLPVAADIESVAIPKAVASTPRRAGKSIFNRIRERYTKPVKMMDDYPAYDSPDHSYHTAFPEGDKRREVPAFRVDAQPAFFLDDTVGRALVSTIDSVCTTKHGTHLAVDVYRMRNAVYRPMGLYKPDQYSKQQQQAWSSVTTPSIFNRQTIDLCEGWVLDIRHATGVYRASGRSWLGVYVHGIGCPVAGDAPAGGLRILTPGMEQEQKYWAEHRGQFAPKSLFFDLFVPVEPEVITEQWGWGEDLELLMKEREANALKDALAPAAPEFPANKWDRKATVHKSARQVHQAQAEIDLEARVLGERYIDATKERERARQVLYSYAWKALLLAVMECRQLTIGEK